MNKPTMVALVVVAVCMGHGLLSATKTKFDMSTPTAINQDLVLTVNCEGKEDLLFVQYSTVNHTKGALLTYDGAPGREDPDGWSDLDGQVYISYDKPGSVWLKRIRAPLPSGRDITAVRVPAVHKLEPGQSRYVRFKLPLPLVERSEYSSRGKEEKYQTVSVSKVYLQIGYFSPTQKTKLSPLKGENRFKVSGQFGMQEFSQASASTRLEIRVRTNASFDSRQ